MLASGVCHSDLHVRDGEWDRPTPIVMGHEGAGIVEAVGPGVTSPRVGDLVALSWLDPVRGVPVVPARATSGRAPTPRRTGTRCWMGRRRSRRAG